jgi:hypothetical protein
MIDWKQVRPSEFIEPRFYVEIVYRKPGVLGRDDPRSATSFGNLLLGIPDPARCYDVAVTHTPEGYPAFSFWTSLAEDAEDTCATVLFHLKEYGYEPV